MNGAILIVLVLAGIAAAVFFVIRSKKKRAAAVLVSAWGFPVPDEPIHLYSTVAGAFVRATTPLANAEATLAAVDEGLRRFFLSTDDRGWPLRRRFEDYDVWLLPPTSRTVEGFPALNMLDGTKIAGIVIGVQHVELDRPFIIAAYGAEHLDYLTRATRNEAEHLGAYRNVSPEEWAAHTAPFHSHPIYALPGESLVERPALCGVCGGGK